MICFKLDCSINRLVFTQSTARLTSILSIRASKSIFIQQIVPNHFVHNGIEINLRNDLIDIDSLQNDIDGPNHGICHGAIGVGNQPATGRSLMVPSTLGSYCHGGCVRPNGGVRASNTEDVTDQRVERERATKGAS